MCNLKNGLFVGTHPYLLIQGVPTPAVQDQSARFNKAKHVNMSTEVIRRLDMANNAHIIRLIEYGVGDLYLINTWIN